MLLAGLGVLISVAATQRARIGVHGVAMMGGHARRRAPFFIVGNDRSGTTMLRLILDRGPGRWRSRRSRCS